MLCAVSPGPTFFSSTMLCVMTSILFSTSTSNLSPKLGRSASVVVISIVWTCVPRERVLASIRTVNSKSFDLHCAKLDSPQSS